MEKPLLSACLITYNHVKYIRQAIEGVLMQKVNFTWELFVADDFSKDGTREIVLEYKKKYPDFIKLILQKKNVGPARNFIDLITAPKSKYIAYFEGDDFWTDPYKLQKQVDFLEKNPDYGLTYSNCSVWYEKYDRIIYNKNKAEKIQPESGWVFEKILFKSFIPTLTVMFQAKLLNNFMNTKEYNLYEVSLIGDLILWLSFSRKTKFMYLDEVFGVYRVLNESIIHSRNVCKRLKLQESHNKIVNYFIHEYGCSQEVVEKVKTKYHNVMLCLYFQAREKEKTKNHFGNLKNRNLKHYLYFIGSLNYVTWWIIMKLMNIMKKVLVIRKTESMSLVRNIVKS